jgi:hypothetical protein
MKKIRFAILVCVFVAMFATTAVARTDWTVAEEATWTAGHADMVYVAPVQIAEKKVAAESEHVPDMFDFDYSAPPKKLATVTENHVDRAKVIHAEIVAGMAAAGESGSPASVEWWAQALAENDEAEAAAVGGTE